jgi:alpha/beta superfamily hydrolase
LSVTRVQFVHGLESGPGGTKARYLAERFPEAVTPAMNTKDFEASVQLQLDTIREKAPDVLVGSSFGGAVAVALLQRGAWSGPTILLAPAVKHLGLRVSLPENVRVIIVHGTQDDIVDIETSRLLAKCGSPGHVELIEVDDAHRLQSLVSDATLADLVERVAQPVMISGPA